MRSWSVALLAAAAVLTPTAGAFAATAPPKYKNCTEYTKVYKHGVGQKTAHDKTSGTPVTTFRKDDAEYGRAMHWNRGLDRDGDKIACEKR